MLLRNEQIEIERESYNSKLYWIIIIVMLGLIKILKKPRFKSK